MKSQDLDSPHYEAIPMVLRAAAEAYLVSASELQAAWQDDTAGAIWADFARILESAADKCDRAIAKRGL